jgi:glycosyltransferase involved in cell wall biosynthesis
MKLLQINTDANWGSHGRIAEDIGLMMIDRGWGSYLAYGRCVNPSKSHLIRIETPLGNNIHAIETRLFDNHGLSSRTSTKKFVKEILELQPDIIHLHNLHGYYLNYEILFEGLKRLGKPIVWTFHDCWPFTGHCAYPVYTNCRKWKSHCCSCDQVHNYPKSLFLDRSDINFRIKKSSFLSVDDLHIVTVSDWLKEETKQSFFEEKEVRRIYNGIDTDVFKPTKCSETYRKYNIPDDKTIVLGVASLWEERKGLSDFVSLFEALPSSFKIVLVGLNKKQAETIPSGIIKIERTNNIDELAELYSAADVYVNPSLAETFGMTTAEALSCGTPSIVYNTTACPELVDGETGRVVEIGNIEGLARAVIELSTKDKAEMSRKCRDRAIALFNKKDRYIEYLSLYKEILHRDI